MLTHGDIAQHCIPANAGLVRALSLPYSLQIPSACQSVEPLSNIWGVAPPPAPSGSSPAHDSKTDAPNTACQSQALCCPCRSV